MQTLLIVCASALLLLQCQALNVWHLTDVHYDWDYVAGGDTSNMCHVDNGGGASAVGNYLCDSPLVLVESAINQMVAIDPSPDFIIWTGDDPPHVNQSELSEANTFLDTYNVTQFLTKAFPKTRVFPSIGNHDAYPAHQVSPVPNNPLFTALASYWAHWLSEEALKTLRFGGYYTELVRPGFRIMSINTVYYYQLDKQAVNMSDPAGQFVWIREVLSAARVAGEKVWVIGHVPPGMIEKTGGRNYHQEFMQPVLDAFSGFSDVVIAHFYGHEHTDTFRMYYEQANDSTPSTVMFLAGSVTPWFNPYYTWSIPNNPSLRLYHYDEQSLQIMDWTQLWSNLSANIERGSIAWSVEYTAVEAYQLTPPLTADVMFKLAQQFITDDALFQQYVFRNSISYPQPPCVAQCRAWQLCGILYPNPDTYAECMANPPLAATLS